MDVITPDALYNAVADDTRALFSRSQEQSIERGEVLWPDRSLKQVYAASLRQSLLKKYLPDRTSCKLPDDAALKKFLEVNETCASMKLTPNRLSHELILNEMKDIIYRFWFSSYDRGLEGHPYDSLDRGRMGPGASYGVKGTDFYTKMFSGAMTSTSKELVYFYERYASNSPSWKEAELLRSSIYGSARIVDGNRLAFVPKNTQISRVICTEPSLNMFYQLGFGSLLEDRLKSYFGIDLSDQPEYNQRLARIGSMSGQLSTIDLSSASDSISLVMLREMLPADFFGRLMAYRSAQCDLPDGRKLPLHMVSTMGNGFTFPLQTMLFAACLCAVYRLLGVSPCFRNTENPKVNAGVFGDDIICLTEASKSIIEVLALLGFRTNKDKTFIEGFFRESCGHDYHLGSNVRGVYIKTLSTDISRYVAFNLLNIFSARSGIKLQSAQSLLLHSVRFLPVPEWENNDAGLRLPLFLLDRVRYDRNNSYIYYKNVPKVQYLVFGEAEVRQPRSSRAHPRIYNPEGALITFLVGGIRHSKVSLRNNADSQRYGRRRAVAPCWEMTARDAAKAGVPTARWRTACASNFG